MELDKEIRNRINELNDGMNTQNGRNHAYDYGQKRGLYFALEKYKSQHTTNKTKDEVLRLVDLLELQIKICDCSAGIKYDMLDKIDNIHSVINNIKCESANTKDEDIKVNVKYELDKEAYRQYVADMKDIEAEFKADNMFIGVAGEKLEGGDAVYQNTDGKMYKSDCIPATLKSVCKWWINKYKRNSTFDEYNSCSNIAENMEYILKRIRRQ